MTALNVDSETGVPITGLTIGNVYSIWSQGGPWHPHGLPSPDDSYAFELSLDGINWGPRILTSYDPLQASFGENLPSWATSRRDLDSVHVQVIFTASTTTVYARVADNPGQYGDNTGSLDVEIGDGSVPFCVYGTTAQPGFNGAIIVTTGLIDLALLTLHAPAGLAVLFDTFIGRTIYGGDLCSSPPPLMPTFTEDDYRTFVNNPNPATLAKVWQAIQAVAWPTFCACSGAPTGSPPPIAPPEPTIILPPNAPPGPIRVNCDSGDLCDLVNQLVRQLTGLSGQIAQLRSDVTLIQRQHVPFGYVPGTLHTGLTGAGTFAVQGILGLSVQTTSIPAYLSSDMAPVQSWFKLGEVSWGTADGWMPRRIVTHNPHLFLDIDGSVTEVGYQFEPGVVANILELLREP